MQPQIKAYIKKRDVRLYVVLLRVENKILDIKPKPASVYFLELVDSIVSQQLSGKVATVIFNRFKNLFLNSEITPEAVLNIPDQKIRDVGISFGKISYIKDLAIKVVNNEIDLSKLDKKTDQEIINELVSVRGIGPWTAEMFLIFTLGREDVYSYGDLGLQNAIKNIYGIDKKDKLRMEKLTNKWKPYRSFAARILWKSLEI